MYRYRPEDSLWLEVSSSVHIYSVEYPFSG